MTIFGVALLIFCGGMLIFLVFVGTLGSDIFENHKESGNLMPTIIGFAIGLLWGLKIMLDKKNGQSHYQKNRSCMQSQPACYLFMGVDKKTCKNPIKVDDKRK